MLNFNENKILNLIKDEKYMGYLKADFNEIKTVIKRGIEEFKKLESIVDDSYNNNEKFIDLCTRLNGYNEFFNAEYPDYNYFDLNYKSLLVTIKEKLDNNNNSLGFEVLPTDVYIYPDNISKVALDEMCVLDLSEEIDFEKIKEELDRENSQEL